MVHPNPRVPWFRKGGSTADYPTLCICNRCKNLMNVWDYQYYGGVCGRCFYNKELCVVCNRGFPIGSLDYTRICQDCRNSGRWMRWMAGRHELRFRP
jgi:hypothetical protein